MKTEHPPRSGRKSIEVLKLVGKYSLLIAAITLIISYFVSFSLQNFSRVSIIFQAGAFTSISVSLLIIILVRIGLISLTDARKRTRQNLLFIPATFLFSGIVTELIVFRIGGIHFFWVLGTAGAIFIISAAVEAHARIKELIEQSISGLKKTYVQIVMSLNASLDSVEPYNRGHAERTAWLADKIAQYLDFNHKTRSKIVQSALLHDIGKIGISEKILLKKKRLEPDEWKAIRNHPFIAVQILKPLNKFAEIASIIQFHHERIDGKGYRKVPGDKIPIESRVLTVAEAFDAMLTPKPYHRGVSTQDALKELTKCADSQFDQEVVQALIRIIDEEDISDLPTSKEIQKILGLLASEKNATYIDLENIIHGTAKRISFLNKTYLLMELRDNRFAGLFIYCLVSALMISVIAGSSIFSLHPEPIRQVSAGFQGLIIGVAVFILYPIFEKFRKYSHQFTSGNYLSAILFFPAGLLSGALSLYLVSLNIYPDEPTFLNFWNISYIIVVGILVALMSIFFHLASQTAAHSSTNSWAKCKACISR